MPKRIETDEELEETRWPPVSWIIGGLCLLFIAGMLLTQGGDPAFIGGLLGVGGLVMLLIGIIGKGVEVGRRNSRD